MEKEPLSQSERFRLALVTIIVELGLLFLPSLGLNVDPDLLQTIAAAIAGIVATLIYGRSIRNTPS